MKIVIDKGDAYVDEPDDFTSLSVSPSPGLSMESVVEALASQGVGELRGDNVWLAVGWLESRLGPARSPGLAAMLDFAKGRGWVSSDAKAVRAHLETRLS